MINTAYKNKIKEESNKWLIDEDNELHNSLKYKDKTCTV